MLFSEIPVIISNHLFSFLYLHSVTNKSRNRDQRNFSTEKLHSFQSKVQYCCKLIIIHSNPHFPLSRYTLNNLDLYAPKELKFFYRVSKTNQLSVLQEINNVLERLFHDPLVWVLLRLRRQTGQESCCKKTTGKETKLSVLSVPWIVIASPNFPVSVVFWAFQIPKNIDTIQKNVRTWAKSQWKCKKKKPSWAQWPN